MTAPTFAVILAVIAYALVCVSAIRLMRWFLDWCDARTLAEFRAQMLAAEAERAAYGVAEDVQ